MNHLSHHLLLYEVDHPMTVQTEEKDDHLHRPVSSSMSPGVNSKEAEAVQEENST